MQGIFQFPLIGKIEIKCHERGFYEFVKRQMYCYFEEETGRFEQRENHIACIRITESHTVERFADILSGKYKLSRNINVKDDRMYVGDVVYEVHNGKLEISASLITKARQLKIKIGTGMMSKEKNYARYHNMFYQYVLYPIFSLYSVRGYYVIHGSIVVAGEKTLVLAGLDGVGKSSLANEFQKKGALLQADNFVLWNGQQVLPFQLAIRLSPQQKTGMKIIYADRNVKEVIPITGHRKEMVPDYIFILLISDKLFMERLEMQEVYFSNYLNNAVEIGAANSFLSPFYFDFMHKGKLKEEKRKYNIKTSILGIPKGKLEEGVKLIEDECNLFFGT